MRFQTKNLCLCVRVFVCSEAAVPSNAREAQRLDSEVMCGALSHRATGHGQRDSDSERTNEWKTVQQQQKLQTPKIVSRLSWWCWW